MERAIVAERPRLREALRRSESGKAAGLAAATLINNAIQLVFTVVFTRLLGATGYGTLAALVSAFLILLVAGQSVQVAAAREAALDQLGHPEAVRATLRAWMHRLLLGLLVATVASVLLREQIAAAIGVDEAPWGAAAILPTGVLWMLISLQRGALQGLRAYGPVGASIVLEGLGRLLCALLLVGVGLGVTGAMLGTPLAFALVAIGLERVLHQRVGPIRRTGEVRSLRGLVGDGWVGILGLFLLAALQNMDVIVAKHQLGDRAAGSYAAAAVAAKSVVWVAIGIGLHLLPEATRRAAAGLDPRPVLLRALGILVAIAAPALLIFAAAPDLLLRVAFGPELTLAAGALLLLGAAMTLLAVAYLTVQYMVALGETRFLWVLGAIALSEPVLLAFTQSDVVGFAAIVFGVQCVVASSVLVLGLRAGACARPAPRELRRAPGGARRGAPRRPPGQPRTGGCARRRPGRPARRRRRASRAAERALAAPSARAPAIRRSPPGGTARRGARPRRPARSRTRGAARAARPRPPGRAP